MSQLPRLLEVLASTRSDALSIVEGAPITLRRADGLHPITKQPLTAAHWRALLAELVPADAIDGLDAAEPRTFPLVDGGNEYSVTVWRQDSLGMAEVRAVTMRAAVPHPAPPSRSRPLRP